MFETNEIIKERIDRLNKCIGFEKTYLDDTDICAIEAMEKEIKWLEREFFE